MIRAVAPGKVVLWGEYAVLAGAPALVMAVDRYARCELYGGGDRWRFAALGHRAPDSDCSREALRSARTPAEDVPWRLVWHALSVLPRSRLPAGGRMRLDTRGFQHQGRKLGLGSSAALCTAVYGACAALLDQPPSYAEAHQAHRDFQAGAGSGIDVAAAWFGGTLRFQRTDDAGPGEARPWPLPTGLQIRFVYSGSAASTTRHLERLRAWRDSGGQELDALAAASERLFRPGDPTTALGNYVTALDELDRAAGLGIFSEPHRRLRQLAFDAGVVYKPCGAGGGDLGAAFTPDRAAAERFAGLAADSGFLPLALEIAPHGIEVTG